MKEQIFTEEWGCLHLIAKVCCIGKLVLRKLIAVPGPIYRLVLRLRALLPAPCVPRIYKPLQPLQPLYAAGKILVRTS